MRKNPLVRFVEFCGTHPFATGLFAIISIASFIFTLLASNQTTKDSARIEQSVESVKSIVGASCASPPCWNAEQAIGGTLSATKDYVDSKLGVPASKDGYGWHYSVGGCPITVHYSDETAVYVSHPMIAGCPFSWKRNFGIDAAMPAPGEVRVYDILDNVFEQEYPPDLTIATGCLSCGNYHDAYVEFRIPGPHVSDFYDRYFSIGFMPRDLNDERAYVSDFGRSLESRTGRDAHGALQPYCGVDVYQSVSETLRNLPVESIGYGRGGRPGYRVDICNEGYSAR